MPRLSIIIACVGDSAEFEDTLAAVLQNRPDDCEVLVALPHHYDDPYGLSGEVVFVEAGGKCGIVELLNAGAAAARGEILHFLDCGLTVQEGWTACVEHHFDDCDVAAVAPLVLDQQGERIVAAGVAYGAGGTRSICAAGHQFNADAQPTPAVDGPALQAAFYRASVFRSLGGFAEIVGPSLADVDLAMSVRAAGFRCLFEPHSVLRCGSTHSSLSGGAAAATFSAGRHAERLFWRSAARRGRLATACLHLVTIAGDFFAALPKPGALLALLGRLAACFETGAFRRHRETIRSAALGEASRSPAPDGSRRPRIGGGAASAAQRVA